MKEMKASKERTTWMILLLVSMVILPKLVTPTLGYETITWNLQTGNDATGYTNMLTSLRTKLQSSLVCGFPTTSKSPAISKQFILMDIVYNQEKTVTVAFQTSNTYFLGFRDMYNSAPRANFVSDEFQKLKGSDLFSDAVPANRKELPFGSSYASMESAAGLNRGNLAVGVENLGFLINKVYGKAYEKDQNMKKELAKFGLTVVQIVAEAARFKYIENDVIKGGLGPGKNFKPSADMIALQKEWGKISQAIHISSTKKPPCEKLEKPTFTFPPNVDTVAGLRPYITVIKFKDSTKFEAGNSTVIDLMEVMEPEFM